MVRFDDRLQTVLRQPASDRHDAAVRWRQLVDLIARSGTTADSDSIGQALAVIRGDSSRLDEPLRAAAARFIAALPMPPGLLECFVADGLAVSAPILAAASLDAEQWQALLAGADSETQQFVEALHPGLAVRPAEPAEPAKPPVGQREESSRRTSISDVVERIERRRRALEGPTPTPRGSPPDAGTSSMFRWECGPDGNMAWADGAPRGALIGRSIAKVPDDLGDGIGEAALRAFAERAPFRDAELVFAGNGAIAGRWTISGTPAFDPAGGRFAGYRGIALRTAAGEGRRSDKQLAFDGDSLRELVHEIKTPLNAIIGFAQIIDGQFLGPAGVRYRERALGIVDEAHILLGAIEDLDFIARARSAAAVSVTADLGQVVAGAVEALLIGGESGGSAFELAASPKPVIAAIDSQSATRLVERMLHAALSLADGGVPPLVVRVGRQGDVATVRVGRPDGRTETADTLPGGISADSMAVRPGHFALRLVVGLARIAGAELTIGKDELSLAFPPA